MAQFVEHRVEHPDGDQCVVEVSGDLDAENADGLRDLLLDCLGRSELVVVDLGGVTFIDSTGLSVLVRLRTEAATLGKGSALRSIGPATEQLLKITGLRELFTVLPTND